jgi:UDP-N-acetylmuramoyl-tripeptide--D-alanyl-D-alanine ligase
MTLSEISKAVNGKIIQGEGHREVSKISTDSRKINPGDLFIALRGERHDAHRYLKQAIKSGACALLVEKFNQEGRVPVIKVEDTLKALQDLARYNRSKFAVPVIAVTGSSGKTTTKDMVASVLSRKYKVLKTEGNFNNDIGLPLTLLNMDRSHQAVVVELAMRGPGEIDRLAGISLPTGAVITNVGEAHLERLGSVKNIAAAKAELLDHIGEKGFAALHKESPYLEGEAARCAGKVIFFGGRGADVYVKNIRREGKGNRFTVVYGTEQVEMYIPVTGIHNVQNALAAVIAGRQLGLAWNDIAQGLAGVTFSAMRMEIKNAGGVTIINDAYNANPSSTKAALQALRETAGNRRAVAVLGNMLELGPYSEKGHIEVGSAVVSRNVDYLITVGDLAKLIARGAKEAGMQPGSISRYADNQEAIKKLVDILVPGDVVLVKGSRGMRMEEIVEGLIKNLELGIN